MATTLTVSETDIHTVYVVGAVATSSFTIPWSFFSVADVTLYVDEVLQVQGTDYDVNAIEADDIGFTGGSVVMVEAVTSARVSLIRSTPIVRETDFPRGSSLSIDVLNRDFDKLTAIAQELAYQIDRAIRLPPTDSTSPGLFLPGTAAERAGLVLGFDETGNNIAMVTPSTDILVVSDATKVPLARTISAGTGLTGGGNLSADRSFALAPSGVTPGTFTFANVTVDTYGRVTAAASNTGSGGGVPTSRAITVSSPLSGGGTLVSDVNIGLADSGVAAGAYTNATLTVSAKGIVTAIASNPTSVEVPQSRTITAGAGLTGGGDLSADRTLALTTTGVTPGSFTNANITVDAYGRLSAASAGLSGGLSSAWYNVKDYGAAGDGSTDDTTAVQAAIDAIGEHGVLYFPAGEYYLTSQITQTFTATQDMTILGDGKGVSLLRWSNGQGFSLTLSMNESHDSTKLNVRHLALTTEATGTGTAFTVYGGSHAGNTARGPDFMDVEVRGYTSSDSWETGIYCNEAAGCAIVRTDFLGAIGIKAMTGIRIGGAGSPTDHYISQCKFLWHGKAILIDGTVEGVTVSQCTMVAGVRGVSQETTGQEPSVFVSNCHMNTYEYGIYGGNLTQSNILGNLIYQDGSGSPESWVAIYLSNADHTVVMGNVIHGWNHASTARNGIVISGTSSYALVMGNVIRGYGPSDKIDTPIWITSGTDHCYASGNVVVDCTNAVLVDSSTGADGLAVARGALVVLTSSPAVSTGAYLSWSSADYDTDGIWSGGSPTRLTVPTGIHKVRLSAGVRITGGSSGAEANMVIKKNSSGTYVGRAGNSGYAAIGVFSGTAKTPILRVNAGDYFELETSYGGTSATMSANQCWFAMELIA